MKFFYCSLFTLLLSSCNESQPEHGHNHANKHMHHRPVSELVVEFEKEERMLTQKPYEVIALFGDLNGKTILDIGAGSGYFTFKLAEKGAIVIAGDVNDEFLDFINSKIEKENLSDNISTRKLPFDSPSLEKEEVDAVLIVNTYHHIEDRVKYFKAVKKGLKENGMLMIVDFMKKEFKEKVEGPPYKMRISSKQVIKELKEADFGNFEVNNELLPHQYAITVRK